MGKSILFCIISLFVVSGLTWPKENCFPEKNVRWMRMQTQGYPESRLDQAMAVDYKREMIFLFGGRNGAQIFDDLWTLDVSKQQWIKIEASSAPSARSGASLVFQPESGKMWLFGGYSSDARGKMKFYQELWSYSENEGWVRQLFKGGPLARAWSAAATVAGKMLVFGGVADAPFYHLRDVWSLDLADISWNRIAADGGPLMAGRPALLPIDAADGMFIFGRYGFPKPETVGCWRLDPQEERWTFLPNATSIARDYDVGAADARSNRFLILRAPNEGKSEWRIWTVEDRCGCTLEYKADLGPPVDEGMACAADPKKENAWICFGGARREKVSNETWRLVLGEEE